MKNYQGLLLDLDGTMYKGEQVIEEAPLFVETCKKKGIPYLFLTNNSSRMPSQVAEKLNRMGISSRPDQVYTSSMAAAAYISQNYSNPKIYMIGEEGLETALTATGATLTEEGADIVVVGIDREFSYEKMKLAALNIQNGADFLSTNEDKAIPSEEGLLPGNGAITEAIAHTTGVRPEYLGKPQAFIVEQALSVLGVNKEEALLVGDNYYTDILAGINAGIDTLMVETGATSFKDLNDVSVQPTYKVKTLEEWKDTP